MVSSGYGSDGIYRSKRPPIAFPSDPVLSVVAFLFRDAAAHPDRAALVDAGSGRRLSFRELESCVASFAAGLSRLGVKRGDAVLVFAENSIHFPVCFLSVLSLGAVATTANPSYTVPELLKQARDSRPKLVITLPRLWDKARSLRIPTIIIGSGSDVTTPTTEVDVDPVVYFSDMIDSTPTHNFKPPTVRQSDVAALFYSSGTTGASKGVMLTHRNFICASLMASADQDLDLDGDPPNTFLCFLPMFHVFGLSVGVLSQLHRGNTVVVMRRFDVGTALRMVEKYKVSHMYAAPPAMLAFAKHGKGTRYDLGSLRWICSGAAPIGVEVMEEVSRLVPRADLLQGYGLTESGGHLSLGYGNKDTRQFGSAGFLVSGVECKVVSIDTLKPLPPNQQGELWFRGPNIMKGYLNNLEATKKTIDEQGWLHTGDLGYIDENGCLFIVDRIKDLIKYKGFQVAPAELEGLLTSHPNILDAAVIPFSDAEAGEVPIAFVVRSQDSSLTTEDVQKFVANQVAPYKRLRRITFVNNIPKSAAGKIIRRELVTKITSKM